MKIKTYDYQVLQLVECSDYDTIYGTILLNKKHDINDFQQAIYNTKNKFYDNGFEYWCIDDVLQDEVFEQFDYIWLDTPGIIEI